MPDFDPSHIRRLDLTLLLVFEAAMDTGKLTAAAQRVGLTQSAVSHALKRLREVFEDELFIRVTHGVRPTQRALTLREPIRNALQLIADAVQPPHFDPRSDTRIFRIAAPDYETSLFAPLLAKAMRPFPGLQVVFRPMIRRDAIAATKDGEVDIVLGYTWDHDRDCEATILFEEEYRVVARKGHAIFKGSLDARRYASFGHVLVSPGGSVTGIVDKALGKQHLGRRVVVAVPYFLAAMVTVACSDLIATLPRRVVECHAAGFGLSSRTPPMPIRSFPVSMLWSRQLGADPATVWLRETIKSSVAKAT